jgi:predicted permease
MAQTLALIWLKWRLFRSTMGSRRAQVSSAASLLGTIAALALALVIAVALGFAAYALSSPVEIDLSGEAMGSAQTNIFLMFTLMATFYLLWGTLPLTIGGVSQFDPGRLLLYPISMRKLFAIDFLSEFTSLGSIFAVPAVLAMGLGAGLRNERVAAAMLAAVCAIMFGIALAKWIAATIGALIRSRRTRGETLVAMLGAGVGLLGAFTGQLIAIVSRHGEFFRGMRWTPPGAAAIALTVGLRAGGAWDYALSLLTLAAYICLLTVAAYRVARRAALGAGGASRSGSTQAKEAEKVELTAGWHLPFTSAPLSAMLEKELRYAMRNAQLRVLALMPLILLAFRIAPSSGNGRGGGSGAVISGSNPFTGAFAPYGEGLIPAAWMLYVFMILGSVACNLFAYEEGGMRSLILAPVDRRVILLGKNMVVALIAFIFSGVLVIINELAFRDVSPGALLFMALCFPLFAATQALIGNLLSIHFPKRLQFGKRMNVSGVAGLLLLPLALLLAVPPFVAAALGYLAQSLIVKYATLSAFASAALLLYRLLIERQGRSLARREVEILEAVSGQTEV